MAESTHKWALFVVAAPAQTLRLRIEKNQKCVGLKAQLWHDT